MKKLILGYLKSFFLINGFASREHPHFLLELPFAFVACWTVMPYGPCVFLEEWLCSLGLLVARATGKQSVNEGQ